MVIDASVALKWMVEEPGSAEARRLLRTTTFAPDLLIPECTNALWAMERRGRITADGVSKGTELLSRGPLRLFASRPLIARALDIARALHHPAYDCFYLALAELEDVLCLTADERFASKVARSKWRDRVSTLQLS